MTKAFGILSDIGTKIEILKKEANEWYREDGKEKAGYLAALEDLKTWIYDTATTCYFWDLEDPV